MRKINVLYKFNTSFGVIFVITEKDIKIGDVVCDTNNDIFEIVNIIFPTKPYSDSYSVVVKKIVDKGDDRK